MRKIWVVGGIAVGLLLIGSAFGYFTYFKADSRSFLSKAELADPDLLASTKAILYFSTTADQDINKDGLSYAVFIDKDGESRFWKMNGLELGTVFEEDGTLFLEERNKVHLVNADGLQTIDMPIGEHTGEVTGFNNKDGLFYSVYNSGFTDDGGNYHSNIRIGNSEGFDTIEVPYYLYSSGMTDEDLLMLTYDDRNFESTLMKMPLQKDVVIEDVASLGSVENRLGMSAILQADGHYYIVMVDNEKLENDVYRINDKTKQVDVFPLGKFESEEAFHVRIPYNVRNSAAIVNDTLYYVDGIGDVYSFHTKKEQSELAFTLEGASSGAAKMSEQIYFQNGKLHFYRYHTSSKSYSIDTYDLDTGTLIEELPITGIDEMYKQARQKSKRLSSYDFVVVE